MGEHLPCKQGVKSSNLSISIRYEGSRKAAGSHASMYLENHILNISRKVETEERFARTSNLWKTIQDIRGVIS